MLPLAAMLLWRRQENVTEHLSAKNPIPDYFTSYNVLFQIHIFSPCLNTTPYTVSPLIIYFLCCFTKGNFFRGLQEKFVNYSSKQVAPVSCTQLEEILRRESTFGQYWDIVLYFFVCPKSIFKLILNTIYHKVI